MTAPTPRPPPLSARLELRHLAEHPQPFWRAAATTSAAWAGHLPHSFSLLARAPAPS